jgi:iron complex transport system substrate-binding protein
MMFFRRKKSIVFIGALLLGLQSCQNETIDKLPPPKQKVAYHAFNINYAQGFEIKQKGKTLLLYIRDIGKQTTVDSLVLTSNMSEGITFFERCVAQSTTYLAYYQLIDAQKQLIGLCGMQYLSEATHKQFAQLNEICNAQGIDYEKIVQLQPDLVFLYPFGDKDQAQIRRFGIPTLFLTEYLETSPLARAEWLKLFALLSGKNPNETVFEQIEKDYLELCINSKSKENRITVAFNLPFGDTWDMPAEQSISAQLVRDAGLHYTPKNKSSLGNLLYKKEEAFALLATADYWLVIADRPSGFKLKDLLAENRIYETFPSVQNKRVIFCNTATAPYFTEGPIEPQVMLSDLQNCIAGKSNKHKYFNLLD